MASTVNYYKAAFAVLMGIGARIAYTFIMPEVTEPLLPALITCTLIYFFFGTLAGFILRGNGWQLGFLIATPMLIWTGLSMFLGGIYTPKIFTTDIPILVAVTIAACLGVYMAELISGIKLKARSST